jgi:hypothetical protein
MPKLEPVTIEGARIVFRNFAGKATPYNAEGNRNFAVVLDAEMADRLETAGWNVQRRPPKVEGDDEFRILKVKVHFTGRKPPRIVLITSRGRTQLSEDLAEMLDYADLETVDLIVRPYEWEVNGKTGVKAYLQSIYATIREDELERKYADVPEIGYTNNAPLELMPGESEYAEIVEDPNG